MNKQIGNDLKHSLFISDLHLCHTRPNATNLFLSFLTSTAPYAESLYILGDLFEYWAGDDDVDNEHIQAIISGFNKLASKGITIFFIHGNRDFLIGERFTNLCNITLLNDPSLLHLYGKRVLLSHGDTLCTDDLAYQAFRKDIRQDIWQKNFLAQDLGLRKSQIESLRMRSEKEKSYKTESIMDVNSNAVESYFRDFDFPDLLIHGHTHRPAKHSLKIESHHVERWVLGDWYDHASCLRLDECGISNILVKA